MDLLTITALLYVSSVAFFHAGKKRTAFAKVKSSEAVRRSTSVFAWTCVFIALGLIVSRKGWEVGIFLWLGAWIAAAVTSIFLEALWKRAHLPSAALCIAIFAAGLFIVPWGSTL
ncbi:MAG: DUF3325 family protein [Pseudomonadota bacterium]